MQLAAARWRRPQFVASGASRAAPGSKVGAAPVVNEARSGLRYRGMGSRISCCSVARPPRQAGSPTRTAARSPATSRTPRRRPTPPPPCSSTTPGSSWPPHAAGAWSYERFHTGYKQMDLAHDELIVAVHLPRRTGWIHHYRKVGARRAQAISKICFAAAASMDGSRVGYPPGPWQRRTHGRQSRSRGSRDQGCGARASRIDARGRRACQATIALHRRHPLDPALPHARGGESADRGVRRDLRERHMDSPFRPRVPSTCCCMCRLCRDPRRLRSTRPETPNNVEHHQDLTIEPDDPRCDPRNMQQGLRPSATAGSDSSGAPLPAPRAAPRLYGSTGVFGLTWEALAACSSTSSDPARSTVLAA